MATFDDYAALRKSEEQESLQARELTELAAGTVAIQRGVSNGWNWFWVAVGFVGAPFTWGATLLISVAAGIKMSGGPKHMVKAALPMTVDIVAPKAGCVRVISGLVTIVLVLLVTAFILALIAFNMGAR